MFQTFLPGSADVWLEEGKHYVSGALTHDRWWQHGKLDGLLYCRPQVRDGLPHLWHTEKNLVLLNAQAERHMSASFIPILNLMAEQNSRCWTDVLEAALPLVAAVINAINIININRPFNTYSLKNQRIWIINIHCRWHSYITLWFQVTFI